MSEKVAEVHACRAELVAARNASGTRRKSALKREWNQAILDSRGTI